jgi:signal peptidase I
MDYLIQLYQSAYNILGGGLYIILVMFTFIGVVAQWSLYEKCGQPGVACIVPIWNLIVWLRIVGRPAWQILLLLVPVYNIYFFFKVFIEICQCFGKTSMLDYFLVVVFNAPYVIYLGLSADTEYQGPLYGAKEQAGDQDLKGTGTGTKAAQAFKG